MSKTLSQDHVYSFSAISGFQQCPLSFRMKYIDEIEGIDNGFSDFGTFCHSVLEMFAKGAIKADECSYIFAENFNESVVAPYPRFPANMKGRAYERGLDYFNSFEGFGDKYKIVAVEQDLPANIGAHKFRGIIDLVLQDIEDEGFVIIDHKTKSESSMKREINLYKKQLYLYAHLYYTNNGNFPKAMGFNMINTMGLIMFDFNMDEYNEALKWAEETINEIIMTTEFEGRHNKYFCDNICGMRNECPHLTSIKMANIKEDEYEVRWDVGI